jgi:TRAP-type C4-dicarboxylate transport system substrate-binding protein
MQCKNFGLRKIIITFVCLISMICINFPYTSKALAASDIKWNFSLFGGVRDITRPLHKWSEDMNKATNGKWQIKLHYGSVLSPAKSNLDGLKAGLFEAMQICAAYIPGKLPLHTVHELPFFLPKDAEKINQMMWALWKHPALLKELGKWNAVPLIPAALPQYGLMTNKPVHNVKDLDGLRIRIAGEMARIVSQFGAVPAMMPGPDIYEAMERGTIDAVTLPWAFAFGAFKINEVSKYAIINFAPGSMCCPFFANKTAWDSLPDAFKKLHLDWIKDAPKIWANEYKKGDDKWIQIYKKQMEFIEFPSEEHAKLAEKADTAYKDWVKRMEKKGLPGKEVFDYYKAKRKEIAGY